MSNRQALVAETIKKTPWYGWTPKQVAGDASARRYTRLSRGPKSVILMDADPNMGLETQGFAELANWLRQQALAAPEVYFHDSANGVMVIEDLGLDDVASWARDNPDETPLLYAQAADVLVYLDGLQPPDTVARLNPIVAGQMLDVTGKWYSETDTGMLSQIMQTAFSNLCGPPEHIALRDFHAENLIWRPQKTGLDRIGLLDFQDAVIAPRGYDLISLTRDARRKFAPDIVSAVTHQFASAVGQTSTDLSASLACLSVQRNLRILGVFSRLARRDGKRRYLRMIPRLWSMIQDDLTHPALVDLQGCVQSTLPPPEHSAIKDLL